jgi:hypothetical protein
MIKAITYKFGSGYLNISIKNEDGFRNQESSEPEKKYLKLVQFDFSGILATTFQQ